jgi:nucleotide-binding universal stress UspA family protein
MSELPEKILLATDGSEGARRAGRAAVDLARRAGAELHVVHAFEPVPPYSHPSVRIATDVELYRREAEELLERETGELEAGGAPAVRRHLVRSPYVDGILDVAERLGADLIVLGSRGLGPIRRLLLGSVSEGVVHHARCPVLVVRGGPDAWPPERVVIADDGSEPAAEAAALGHALAGLLGAEELMVRAHPKPPMPIELPGEQQRDFERVVSETMREDGESLEEHARELEQRTGRAPKTELVLKEPAVAVLESAGSGERTLIVLGARGLGALSRVLLGSVSNRVLRAAQGPVLIHPHDRHRTSAEAAGTGREAQPAS